MSLILHLDVDAFTVAVERNANRALDGRPVVVGDQARGRGLVTCASYEARALGVRAGMPLSAVKRRAPGAVILPTNKVVSERVSRELFAFLRDQAPVVEQDTEDDFFLDLTGCEKLFGGDLHRWAVRLAKKTSRELGLPISAGLATNKLMARVATRLAKPGRVIRVLPGVESEFLESLSVRFLPGVGRKTREELREFGIRRIGQLSGLGEDYLRGLYGDSRGTDLWLRAQGIFHEPVMATPFHTSISRHHTFSQDTSDLGVVQSAGAMLAQRICWDLRCRETQCHGAIFALIYCDGMTNSRRVQLLGPTNRDNDLIPAVRNAVAEAFRRRVRVRTVRLTAELELHEECQSDFFLEQQQRRTSNIYAAMDAVRSKHGFSSMLVAETLLAVKADRKAWRKL